MGVAESLAVEFTETDPAGESVAARGVEDAQLDPVAGAFVEVTAADALGRAEALPPALALIVPQAVTSGDIEAEPLELPLIDAVVRGDADGGEESVPLLVIIADGESAPLAEPRELADFALEGEIDGDAVMLALRAALALDDGDARAVVDTSADAEAVVTPLTVRDGVGDEPPVAETEAEPEPLRVIVALGHSLLLSDGLPDVEVLTRAEADTRAVADVGPEALAVTRGDGVPVSAGLAESDTEVTADGERTDDIEPDGETDGERRDDGLRDGDSETLGDDEPDADSEGDCEERAERESVGDIDGEPLADRDSAPDRDDDGDLEGEAVIEGLSLVRAVTLTDVDVDGLAWAERVTDVEADGRRVAEAELVGGALADEDGLLSELKLAQLLTIAVFDMPDV